jgi:hypothetical protein|tara:strand:+ start:1057 stop:1302 length:246 start_codon:yes stop_codon:yes gene_type:complete
MMIWENTFIVFDVTKGPKVIIESLNTYGEEGWECSTMITVANTNIVAFLKRRVDVDDVVVDETDAKISQMWSASKTTKKGE